MDAAASAAAATAAASAAATTTLAATAGDAPQGQRRKRAKPVYCTRDAETAPSVFAQPGGSMFSPAFAQGMMLAELNASRARVQSEREGQARILGFMGVPMGM